MSPTPADEVRRFDRVATQRLEDARFLLGHRNTAAIYLAGYAVECTLKALWLSRIAGAKSARAKRGPRGSSRATKGKAKLVEVMEMFRGKKGHSLEWLKKRYLDEGGDPFPASISQAFSRVNSWDTDLRYNPGTSTMKEASRFLLAVENFMDWARGRF